MAETSRVARWRQRLRDEGKAALTIWLADEDKARLVDMAQRWRTTPSALVTEALAGYQPTRAPMALHDTDTPQLRLLIQEVLREELPGTVQALAPATDTATETVTATSSTGDVTDTVTDIIAATLARDLPPLVRQIVEELALEALTLPVTDTYGDVAVTEARGEIPAPALAQSRPGRPPSAIRQHILAALVAHPEGLTGEEIRVHIAASRPIGNVLQGMRRTGAVETTGTGRATRYYAKA